MVTDALQIRYKTEEYEIYKKWTCKKDGDSVRIYRYRQIGFLFALFKIRNNNHIQAVVSGDYGQGKTSAVLVIAKYETLYIKRLLQWYKKKGNKIAKDIEPNILQVDESKIHFNVNNNVIISAEDPASKYLYSPEKLRSYIIDDAFFFTSTGEANTTATKKILKAIAGNRKKNVSNYWLFGNLFKMPSAILETQVVWIHKEDIAVGDVIIPNRVIQFKEKFARETIEKYAKLPKAFKHLIRFHPSFITKIKFPKLRGKGWDRYLAKYDKYKWTEDKEKDKKNNRLDFFEQLEKVLEKNIRTTTSAKSREELINQLIFNAIKKKSKNESQSKQIATTFTNDFIKWQEDKLAGQLTKELSNSLLKNTNLELEGNVETTEEAG